MAKKKQTKKSKGLFGGFPLVPESVKLLPHVFCITNNVVVLGEVEPNGTDPINIGLSNPNKVDLLDLVSAKFGGRKITPVVMPSKEVLKAINVGFGFSRQVKEEERVKAKERSEKTESSFEASADSAVKQTLDGLEPVSVAHQEDRPIIDIVNNLLLDALRKTATDIHLENERKFVQVRFKVDGMLYKFSTPIHKDNVEEIISRIKIMADLDISEHRIPQDGRVLFRTLRNGKDYDVPFRISILPGPYGEEIVLRVLDKSMAPINLELLGFTNRDLKLYRNLVRNPQGMVLVTGPTGAGKTTTLYATLKEINSPFNKILSAEDPIEYNLDGVNQKQITGKFGFAEMARAFLRHDPDILLIGEIRDQDTADVACKAAQTGHLILPTIHPNDSISTISRLQSLVISSNTISVTMLGALSQRLVRRICNRCVAKYEPSKNMQALFGDHIALDSFVKGAGCKHCNNTGFSDRIGIFELFNVDDELQDMIQMDALLSEILAKSMIKGMVPLTVDGLLKVEQRITTFEELIRVIPKRQILAQLQKRYEEI